MDSLRNLNEATARNGGYASPPGMYYTLSHLSHVAHETAKAVEQAGLWLETEQRAGRVTTDGDSDLDSVTVAIDALAAARAHAAAFASSVDAASAASRYLAPLRPEVGDRTD